MERAVPVDGTSGCMGVGMNFVSGFIWPRLIKIVLIG